MMRELSLELKDLAAGYVLDELTPSEVQQVERLMLENALLRQEVQELQATLGAFVLDVPAIAPPPGLRDRTLQAFTQSLASEPAAAVGAPVQLPQTAIDRRVAEVTRVHSGFAWAWFAAAIALLGAAGLAWDNWQLRRQLSLARSQPPESVAQILQRPKSRLVALSGTQVPAAGTLLFTPGQWQEVVLSLRDLPPLEGEQVYRLWLTLANDQTLYCGEFNPNAAGQVSVRMNPPQQPPQGVKATGLFVTVDRAGADPQVRGDRILTGTI